MPCLSVFQAMAKENILFKTKLSCLTLLNKLINSLQVSH